MRGKLAKDKITNTIVKRKILSDLPKLGMPYYDPLKVKFRKHTDKWITAELTFCIPNQSWMILTKYCIENKYYISYDNGCVGITSFR
jgi:hypothetical protein